MKERNMFKESAMLTAKQEVEVMLTKLPENSTLEDIQYHLYVIEKVRRGIDVAEEKGTVSQQDAEARLSTWITK